MNSINAKPVTTASVHIHGFDNGFKRLIANMPTQHYETGQALFTQGEKCDVVYYIHEGATKILRSENDQQKLKCISGQGTLVGYDIISFECYTSSAIAITPCTATIISQLMFIEIIQDNKEIGKLFMRQLCESAVTRTNLGKGFLKYTPLQRTSCALILIQRALNKDELLYEESLVPMEIKYQDLADLARVNKQKAYEIVEALHEYGVLKVENNTIIILDLVRLAANLCR